MKTQYQHFRFIKIAQRPKTSIWSCQNNRGQSLGLAKWYSPWRQYCYFANTDAVYSKGCLADIGTFLGELAEERKQQRAMDRPQLEG